MLIPRSRRYPLQRRRNIRPNVRNIVRKPSNRGKEVSKQDEDAIQLNQEADKRPPHQYQANPRRERRRALDFLSSRKEGESLLDADDQRQADEEEDVAHCEHGSVEEEEHAAEEEEATTGAEGYAYFCS